MDIKLFLKFLNRYKWIIILIPVIVVAVTWFFVQDLPKQYRSEAQISTGLLDQSKKVATDQNTDFFKINQQFGGIIEKMKMKKVINILSYNLILHDLADKSKSFRKYSKQLDSLNNGDKQAVVKQIRLKLANKSILTLSDNVGKYKLYDLISSMGYGEENLLEKLDVSHQDYSDFINISFVSEDAELSAYLVNTLAKQFISGYTTDVNFNQNNSISLLDSLLNTKEQVMNSKNNALADFKRNKGVLNLDEQSTTVYAQISQYEEQRVQALREIQANQGAISVIENKLNGSDRYINGSSQQDNLEIINLKRKLQVANNNLVDRGYKAGDQKTVDSLNSLINLRSSRNLEENIVNPKSSKQNLIQQKIALEVSSQSARSSLSTINSQLNALRSRYASMVPYDADIQNYEREADLATKDYMNALNGYNQTKTEQNLGSELQIAQIGVPGVAEPSKKIIYLAGSGILSLLITVAALLGIFVTDGSITNNNQLELRTRSKVIGSLNLIAGKERMPRNIWGDKSNNPNYEIYKDLLRSIRFDLNVELETDKNKILGITSLNNGEGKTFLAYSLAYAFAMTGKKILLISDEAPVVKSDSKELAVNQSFQNFLIKKEVLVEDLITVMNKNSVSNSLLELQNINNLRIGFDILRKQFDLIIIDINGLHEMNITKEWLMFTEKNIAVFESGRSIKDYDQPFIKYIKSQSGFSGWILNKVKFEKNS